MCTVGRQKRAAGERRKRVMVLMSDTGGGHRASAEALKAGFQKLYGDKYEARPLSHMLTAQELCKPPSMCRCTVTSALRKSGQPHALPWLSSAALSLMPLTGMLLLWLAASGLCAA